ncbi:MAG: UbiD family decarboxylase [Desulfobacteraceae bacterium]|nr:MAG: UbiD family decarboxylase [Desulfobacteraceae bacterium]
MEKIRDLRDWLKRVEELGELHLVEKEVDWNEELTAITYMAAKKKASPALLFEKIKGYPGGYRVLSNIMGSSLNRIALSMGLPINLSTIQMIKAARDVYKKPVPPVEIGQTSAPVNENVLVGDDIDLFAFPSPKMWPFDGGRYIGTGDVVITRDPELGHLNLGTYRQMIQSGNKVAFYVSPGKDALLHREKYWKKHEPCEVAAAYGIEPALLIVGAMGFPKNVSEYDYAGALKGEQVRVVRGQATDLMIPADAEIVIEGVSYPDQFMDEGPFGEFQGYYGRPGGPTPFIEVKCIHFRNNPILTAALMADHPSCEQNLFFSVARSARIWDDLDRLGIPGIKGVYCVPSAAGGFGMTVVSMEQLHAGHASQVATLAAQCPGGAYNSKWIVVVDEDVDPTDLEQVVWAMCTRCHPPEDIDILRNTWSTYLDPTRNPPELRPYGAKVLINACKEHQHLKVFSKRTAVRESVYNKVASRWGELGFDFPPPELSMLERE